LRAAALVLVALALGGCETTAEKSARLERAAQRAGSGSLSKTGLSITRESTDVKVLAATVVRSSEGAAAVVTLRNDSSRALHTIPIAITVAGAGGATLFRNDAPGLQAALVSVSSLPAHGELAWVDDQVPANGGPASVRASVGQAPSQTSALPQLAVVGLRAIEDPSNGAGAAASVHNRSPIAQRNLVVFVVARRAGRVVAAGRAVLPEVPARGSAPFQAFLIGDPRGAALHASAPATTLG
jgi:hypothetical protein